MDITHEKIRASAKSKKKQVPGPDGVHPRVISEVTDELVEHLRIIFERSTRRLKNYTFNTNTQEKRYILSCQLPTYQPEKCVQ